MKLICLSSRKGGGKSTLTKLLIYNGHLLFGDGSEPYSVYPDADGRGAKFLLRSGKQLRVRAYAMADPLKRFCVDVLGLSEECVYGTETQKNQKTHILWENLPHYPRIIEAIRATAQAEVDAERAAAPFWERSFGDAVRGWKNMVENRVALRAPTGPMTGRQVQQQFGSDIVRAMWPEAWTQACLRAIERDAPDVAIVDDCRFEDEVRAVQGAGGVVARLQRNPNPGDAHKSETALDGYEGYDLVMPANLCLQGTCNKFLADLAAMGLVRDDWCTGRVLWPPYPDVSAAVDLAVKHCRGARWDVVGELMGRLESGFADVDPARPGGDCTGYAVMESSP